MKLSTEMKKAIAFATGQCGGELHRHPGGYWSCKEFTPCQGGGSAPYFGTSTVNALVTRGAAKYTEWKESKRIGRFPIKIEVISHE